MRGLICDDHPLMREALGGAMRERWPDLVIDEAGDFPTAWTKAVGVQFCLVDLGMPGAEPLAGLATLREKAPKATLLVVTGLTDETLLRQVRDCGVAAVLSKNTDADALIEAIRVVLPDLRTLEASPLPPRQQQVLQLLADGLTNKEIALRLGISPSTVKIHVARVMSWLGAVNRTDAVARAQRGRMI